MVGDATAAQAAFEAGTLLVHVTPLSSEVTTLFPPTPTNRVPLVVKLVFAPEAMLVPNVQLMPSVEAADRAGLESGSAAKAIPFHAADPQLAKEASAKACETHAVPFAEVYIVCVPPRNPANKPRAGLHASALSMNKLDRSVQVSPSGDEYAPPVPIPTNRPSSGLHFIFRRRLSAGLGVRAVHVMPSVVVESAPLVPDATVITPFDPNPVKNSCWIVWDTQLIPSTLVAAVATPGPGDPIATYLFPIHVTPIHDPAGIVVRIHVVPLSSEYAAAFRLLTFTIGIGIGGFPP